MTSPATMNPLESWTEEQRSAFAGLRMLALGSAAGAVTYVIGRLFGVAGG